MVRGDATSNRVTGQWHTLTLTPSALHMSREHVWLRSCVAHKLGKMVAHL